jgi:ubiquitin C-terminal hydrolase
MGIPFESLKNTREQGFKVSIPQQHKEPAQKSLTQIDLLEEKIFSVILNSMGKSTPLYIDPNLLNYFSAKFQELFNVLAATPYDQKTSPNFMNNFLDKLNEQQKELVARVCMAHLTDVQPEVFEQLVFLFCKHNWKKIVSTIKNDLAVAQQNNDEKKYKELLEKLSALQKGFFKQGAL